ncbi:uracil-DNA glycosylase [Patescibacteria group bacterium]|nr:uracil-DNA glycosylase [Patescibacteria group bacterium]
MNEKVLAEIVQEIACCQSCPLYKTATKPVPGHGNPQTRLVFIGEAPGFHEDQQGLPFVGASGKLLDKLLVGIGFKREDVWIGNMLKHRPLQNRDPLPAELEACKPFLARQIEAINPAVIVTLGRFAMNYFLPEEKISQVHGLARYVVFADQKRVVLPVYHPAAALRNGRMMEALREDFQKIASFLKEPVLTPSKPAAESQNQMELFK